MSKLTTSGTELALIPAEESCPYEYWVPWLKNLALEIINKTHISRKIGYKYSAEDFWEVLILHTLMHLSIDEASNELNRIKWEQLNRHRRRKRLPKIICSKTRKFERLCPHGDQVRKYRQSLPMWVVKKLNQIIFMAQINYALREGLIDRNVSILVDNNNQWYYGSDRFPANPLINKSNKGPGTSRRRNYLGIMIRSGKTSLYCGVSIIKKGHSNVPDIMQCIDQLILEGFQIDYVLGDRWFPTYEFFAELNIRGIYYVGPYKKWAPIKRIIEDFLNKGGDYIRKYTIKGAPVKYYRLPGIPVWLILTNRQGRRLRDIRRDIKRKRLILEDAMKEIMVMVTTFPPPAGNKQRQGWAVGICRKYDRRWQIETGFRDLNRISPPSNAHTNARKFLMRSVQYWAYNAWQLERAKRKRKRRIPKSWKQGPTLRQFSHAQLRKYRASLVF